MKVLIFSIVFNFSLFHKVLANNEYYIPFDYMNYEYTLMLARTLPENVMPKMKLYEILEVQREDNKVREIIISAAKKGLHPLMQSFGVNLIKSKHFGSELNLNTEIIKSIHYFSKVLLVELKKMRFSQSKKMQLWVVPMESERLVARRKPLYKLFYSKDKYPVYQVMESPETAYMSASDAMVTKVWRGLNGRFIYQADRDSKNPFFAMAKIEISIEPDMSKSAVNVTAVIGMPINKEVEFKKETPKIKFEKIIYPSFKAGNGYDSINYASKYPVAFIRFTQFLNKSGPEVLNINFGPLGSFKEGKWVRPSKANYHKQVVRLRGVKAVGEVDFGIYNIDVALDKFKVADIDLYLTLGLRGLSRFKFGFINKSEIDAQFQDEINKSVQSAIAAQEKKLNQTIGEKLNQEILSSLIDRIFTSTK